MRLDDFDFDLPEELIALRPASPRTAARLLVAEGEERRDAQVSDLPDILRAGDLLVFNDTKVIPARLTGERRRETQDGSGLSRIEITLIRRDAGDEWFALAKPLKRLKTGDVIRFANVLSAEVSEISGGGVALTFNRSDEDLDHALESVGAMPIPPYIAARRPADERDAADYQTVFAARSGAVAAPTAALHFDPGLLAALDQAGVRHTTLTLHVGPGTFLPVKVDDVAAHQMHSEWGEIGPEAAAAVAMTKAKGGRVIAVGTTSLRLLETAAAAGAVEPWRGDTDIFITPGYRFRAVDGLMTNFHLPKSTLFMLVSALMGTDRMQALYAHAIARKYRFYSYGDSSLLLPGRDGGAA